MKPYKFLQHDGEHELGLDSAPPPQASAVDEKREAVQRAHPALKRLTNGLDFVARTGESS